MKIIDIRKDLDYLGYFMTKEKLIEIIRGLLKTEAGLNFLLQLKKRDLETLVACIRDRVEQVGKP